MGNFFSSKILIGAVLFLAILASIGLVYNSNKNNTNSSSRVVNQLSKSTPAGSKTDEVQIVLNPNLKEVTSGQSFDVDLMINADKLDVSGVDVSIKFDPKIISLLTFKESTNYSSVILNGPADNKNGNFRFIAVNPTTKPVTGQIKLGTLHFQAKSIGVSSVTIGTTQITAAGHSTSIPTMNTNGMYTVKK